MSNDIGIITKDSNDVAPGSPLTKLNGLNTNVQRQRKLKILRRLSDFDPDLKIQERVNQQRDSWWGTIFDIDTVTTIDNKKYYEVQLQDGQFVQAYYPDQVDSIEWKDNQRVHVIWDGKEYVILTPPDKKNIYLWWEATETLLPGQTAKGKIRYFDNDTEEFKDNNSEASVKDIEYRNFVLRGERVQIRLNDTIYEVIGSFGIVRKAKTKARINANSSGLVTIYSNGIIAQEPHEGVDRNVELTAHLNWATGGKPYEANKEIFVKYYSDEKKWIISGGEC